ncbi:MAG: mechanosensitive ion channel domain-containing protein [Candidatus Neomarinimicrobiota bacterium]
MVENLYETVSAFAIKLIVAIIILIVGIWVSRIIRMGVQKVLVKREVDALVSSFVTRLVYYLIIVFVVIAALGNLGVQTASLIAVFGAAGLAIGLALQGSLANFAAGFLILLFKPYKTGDYIEGGGEAGAVERLQVFSTILRTSDNKIIIIPNANMLSGNIVNNNQKNRRVDLTVGIGYDDDMEKARGILMDMLKQHPLVLKDPEPQVAVAELGDNSVNLTIRPWVKREDYWTVHAEITEQIKLQLDKHGFSIPYPQQDVHLYKHE